VHLGEIFREVSKLQSAHFIQPKRDNGQDFQEIATWARLLALQELQHVTRIDHGMKPFLGIWRHGNPRSWTAGDHSIVDGARKDRADRCHHVLDRGRTKLTLCACN
jgi:hypothetical protein